MEGLKEQHAEYHYSVQVAYCKNYLELQQEPEQELERQHLELQRQQLCSALPCWREPPRSTKYLAQRPLVALVCWFGHHSMHLLLLEAVILLVLSTLHKFAR